MLKKLIRVFSLMLCVIIVASMFTITASAEKITYAKGANDVSTAYKNSRWYKNITSIELTGDGVTDTLAVALAHVSYTEGYNADGFNGTQFGDKNYTEFCRNYGEGNNYYWCAAYVSFALFQSRATTSTQKQTIWRDIYCPRWYENLKNEGYGHDASSSYTPKSGDLVFFEGSGHIGIVRYYKDGTVYTIEGNTSGGTFADNGNVVCCKQYSRNYSKFLGFGALPYKTNDKALKVDYSGENPTTGLWIGETDKNLYATTNLSGDIQVVIPYGTVFEVTKIVNNTCYQVKYNGQTGYIVGKGGAPIYQLTSTQSPEPEVVPNKYAINSNLKQIKEHIGSGISKYTIDGAKVTKATTFDISAGQKIGIEGFAGFSVAIKEFGYYFDDNAEGVVLGSKAKNPTADTKLKAGDKAKQLDIEADTTELTAGEHTVTYVVKLNNGKIHDLVTLKLNVSNTAESADVTDDASGDSSESGGVSEEGCNSAIAIGVALPTAILFGIALIKKKKED